MKVNGGRKILFRFLHVTWHMLVMINLSFLTHIGGLSFLDAVVIFKSSGARGTDMASSDAS